ncbi:hypothetical protein TRM7557_01102 [Tritonibacter multivorans]|uniref:DUF3800 domain-containing protein n=2 Tax=Tritonibacter multivorans TaxID=928856 RepID=A0A0P1G4V6_9RHOB|nr:hypothetical protein TRM7557_01102 [Tritonibacter multivorans]SFD05658.1 Protein of unknown function [Tritonibacter multivorans]
MNYTFFVDETGDAGLDKVRSDINSKGASPFLVFGGVLVPDSRVEELRELLASVRSSLGKQSLHCNRLSHFQTAKYAREVAEKAGVLLFAFVSRKETLGSYKGRIKGKGQDQKYYNKCVSYFLERVGHWMLENDVRPEQLDVVFEKRDGHDYSRLRNYIAVVKSNPNDARLGYFLGPILPSRIRAVSKKDEELLEYADLVAFAVSAAITPSKANFGVPEQRYLRELKCRFFKDEVSCAVGEFGLKVFKRSSIKFDPSSKEFLDGWHVAGVSPKLPQQVD